jgi:FAD-dependent urate hydroxylase
MATDAMFNLKEHHMSADGVLVVGAGPFGLSISAHLRSLGVDHRIVGRPLDTWRAHMPAGMNLKSEFYASDISAPARGYDLATYCKSRRLDYVERVEPLSLERFLGYGDWYTGQLVPDVTDACVTRVSAVDGGFRVEFSDAEAATVQQVVLATGVLPYFHIPGELSGMPADLVSHTKDHHNLGSFSGRRVAVIGAGQSALETAALLHEAGAQVHLIARRPAISWPDPNPEHVTAFGHIRRPVTKLCEGWRCAFWATPSAFQLLPEDIRVSKARSVLGPAGIWWLKDRVEGVIDVMADHRVTRAEPSGRGVRLYLDGPKRTSIDVDHVVAGTGFRIGLDRLDFLADALSTKITTLSGYPVLSRACESSVAGLYFAGAPAAVSLGPSMRFIAGTHRTAPQIARAIAKRSRARRAAHSAPRHVAHEAVLTSKASDRA